MTIGNFRAKNRLPPKTKTAATASATAPAVKAPMATGCSFTRVLTGSPWGGAAALLQLAAPPRACGSFDGLRPLADGAPLRRPQTSPPPCPGAVRRGEPPSGSSGDRLAVEERPHPGVRGIGQQRLRVSVGHHRLRLGVEEHRIVADRLDTGQIV